VTAEWLVIRLEEGSEESRARRFGSAADVQEHIAELISDGVAAESLLLYDANLVKFAVSYKPVINLGDESNDDAGETAESDAKSEPEAQGSQNGVRLSSMFKTD